MFLAIGLDGPLGILAGSPHWSRFLSYWTFAAHTAASAAEYVDNYSDVRWRGGRTDYLIH